MKKEYKVLVLSFVFVVMLSGLAHAMGWEEFIETYPNEYIYRVDCPNGDVHYFSCPVELTFELIDSYCGEIEVGKALQVKPVILGRCFYRLSMSSSGSVVSYDPGVVLFSDITDEGDRIGFQGDIDIYRWSGYGFFLPERSTFQRAFLGSLGGVIRTILPTGFGIVSVMLLVKLLTVYFPRFLHRSL